MRRLLWILVAVAVLLIGGVVTTAVLLASTSGTETPRSEREGQVPTESDDDFGTVDVYAVDEFGALSPDAAGLAAEVWEMFQRVATVEFTAETVLEYRVGDSAESDTMAYVYQSDDPELWVVAANLATSEDRTELLATLIHEYAHILFLSTQQIDLDGECPTADRIWDGCPSEASVIAAFRDAFWADYDDAPGIDNADADLAYEFYLAHEADFANDYAATNAIEDAAESFTAFVLEETPDADTVLAGKLRFFADYPELVEIRDRIRAEFSGEHGLP